MSEGLLDKLKETSAADLSAGVAWKEGVAGATLEPIYSRRRFKCFVVTESELQQIGLANLTATATGSLGSGFSLSGSIYTKIRSLRLICRKRRRTFSPMLGPHACDLPLSSGC
ncbi:hypothetical protein [Rhizobium sp. CC-YZS058]|uniref:hypothetical protein n=1 Tax=Rhizobium sp. CC-YZS058 TaxID=3042153 RepID=UPI002B05E61C|nr:hypothetical protein [Rhizobium sp. CC-YZS058]MEA3533143.1 hypothetical protein [Rhizobium sp. CC-YZS058]